MQSGNISAAVHSEAQFISHFTAGDIVIVDLRSPIHNMYFSAVAYTDK
jgi:hypothetical protein